MKLTLTHYNETYSVEMSDDTSRDPVLRAFVNLLVAAGFQHEAIAERFEDGDPNNWDSAWTGGEEE